MPLLTCTFLRHFGLIAGSQSQQASTITTIDVPGAGLTAGQGINASGDIVGFYTADADGFDTCAWLSIRKGSVSDH